MEYTLSKPFRAPFVKPIRWRHVLFIILPVFLFHSPTAAGMNSPSVPRTNLAVIQSLVEKIATQLVERSNAGDGESISVKFVNGEDTWIAQNALAATLKSLGFKVYVPEEAPPREGIALDIGAVKLGVRYEDMFREGIFGAKKMRRVVDAELVCQVVNRTTNEVIFSGVISDKTADTVRVDDLPSIEQASIKSTHADLPSESLLDRMLEPLVIIGATGVAVYLFFHVRS